MFGEADLQTSDAAQLVWYGMCVGEEWGGEGRRGEGW